MTSRSATILFIQLTKSTIAASCCLVWFSSLCTVCVAAVLQALSVLTAILRPVFLFFFPRTLKACQPFSTAAFRWLMLSLVSCPSGKVRVRPVLLSRSLSSSAALHMVLTTYISLWLIFHFLADVFYTETSFLWNQAQYLSMSVRSVSFKHIYIRHLTYFTVNISSMVTT